MARIKKGKVLKDRSSRLVEMIIGYIKQETLAPLKSLGRFVGFGIAGSIFLTFGLVLGLVAELRALQTATGEFQGNLSWIPYLIVVITALCLIAIAAWRVVSGPAKRRIPKGKR